MTGKPIYEKPISDSVETQVGGLSLSMQSYGYDLFLFWTSECRNIDIYKRLDVPIMGMFLISRSNKKMLYSFKIFRSQCSSTF